MDKTIDTPSREIDLRNVPVHLRTALRRALEFEARAPAPRSAEEAEQCEEQLRAIADEFFGALLTPVLQRAVCSAAVGDAASALVRHLPRRMRSDGLETVNVRTSRGTTVPVTTPYYREKHARRAKRRPGLYPALVVLGIYDRCTPKLASDASRAVAMLSSLAEAQAQLRSEGIALDIKTLRSTAYRYAARARAAQQSAACGLLDRVTGKRVVVSLDGGRVRVRRKKRGPKTKKGRNRFHTDWKEPKLLILYVVGDDGRPSQTWAPIIDGTLRGPEAVFALLLSYARQIGLNAADKVLFIADGAPWIWRRLQRLIAALGLSPTQVLGLIDFYHAAKQLSDAVKLRRWSATQRTRWLNRTRGLLKRARVDEVITALRELCRGRTAGKIRTHLNYFLKNRRIRLAGPGQENRPLACSPDALCRYTGHATVAAGQRPENSPAHAGSAGCPYQGTGTGGHPPAGRPRPLEAAEREAPGATRRGPARRQAAGGPLRQGPAARTRRASRTTGRHGLREAWMPPPADPG